MGRRLSRWWGLLGIALRRTVSRGRSRQVGLTVSGIAIPIALLVVVSGVSLGLVSGTTVRSPDVDYWIVPESASAQSAVVSVEGPQFGRVHTASDRINAIDGVDYATPVLLELVRLQSGSTSEFVLAVGVVPGVEPASFLGASTAGLTPGDPYFENGTWTGEVVLSGAAAELLGARTGDTIALENAAAVNDNQAFTVTAVSEADEPAAVPVALFHLGELQAVAGAAADDQADQFLVRTTRPDLEDDLASVYPRSLVVSRSGFTPESVSSSELPLALAATALLVAVVIGALFAATTMGLAVAADARNRALLAALGFSGRSRTGLIAIQALIVSGLGGLIGVGLGYGGIEVVNRLVARYVVDVPVARFEPVLIAYGLGVALLIGLVTVPYLLVMGWRTTSISDLAE